MPTIDADKVIGKTLIAAKTLDYFQPIGKVAGQYKKGDIIGVVKTYIYKTTYPDLYWVFNKGIYNDPSNWVYVLHKPGNFEITEELKDVFQVDKIEKQEEKEQKILETKGRFRYYVEKYGVWIIGTILASIALRETIRKAK